MGEAILKKFGKYFLLDILARGGMAEIFRARLASSEGAGRILVIKRIQAGFGENDEFIKMFQSEIKVTMGFNHPHIVQLYDFGEIAKQNYIVMEYVDGPNLKQIISKLAEKKEKIPFDVACLIIEQVASALFYAHQFRDKLSGESLNVVHRDISPQNILVTFEGVSKVIDFGIAKAKTNLEATRAGVIKGKPSYLSPEQIRGEPLDGRSDLFSLGTVFWEFLTGKKLFSAAESENEYAVLKLIENCETYVMPPSEYVKEIPKELDHIVLKLLTKHPEKRFSSAEELKKSLHKFLFHYAPDFTSQELSMWIKTLFDEKMAADRKFLRTLNEKAQQLLVSDAAIASELEKEENSGVQKRKETTTVFKTPRPQAIKEIEASLEKSKLVKLKVQKEIKPSFKKKRRTMESFSQRKRPVVEEKKHSKRSSLIALALGVIAIWYFYPQGSKKQVSHLVSKNKTEPLRSTSATKISSDQVKNVPSLVEDEKNSVLLKLNIHPPLIEMKIILNGNVLSSEYPKIRVPLDTPLELKITHPQYYPLERQFFLDRAQVGDKKEWVEKINLEPYHYGFLTLNSTPSADVYLYAIEGDGKTSGRPVQVLKTPIEKEKIPIGTYQLVLKNEILGMEQKRIVYIKNGQIVRMQVQLEVH